MRFRGTIIQSRNNENTFIQRNNVYHVYHVHGKNASVVGNSCNCRSPLHPLAPVPYLSFSQAGGSERMARTCTRLQIPCNKVCKKVNVNVFQNGSRVPTDATPVFFPTAYPKCIRIVSHARGTLPVQFNFPRFDRLILYRLSLRNQIIFRWNIRVFSFVQSLFFFSNKFFFLEYFIRLIIVH